MKKRIILFIQRVKGWAKSYRKTLLVSVCNVVVLTLLTYFLNNQPLFTGENLNSYAWLEWTKTKLGLSNQAEDKDSVLFVNVSYDKQLTEINNEFGIPIGNTDITDRSKLLKFLQMLHGIGGYKYIFLDVRFEKGIDVPNIDKALYSEICKMKSIVVVNHSDIEIADSSLLKKAALGDYKSTIVSTNFVRYEFSYGGIPTMPLYAYKEITGKDINSHLLFYTCDSRLCYNSLCLDFPIEDSETINAEGEPLYYNLGSDLLENYSEKDLATLVKDKYVVIGDMVEDIHDTYSGSKPGSEIMYVAFRALMTGKHFVSYGIVLLFALLYFIISFFMFDKLSVFERLPFVRKSHSKLLYFVLSLVEYTFLMSFVAILLFVFFDVMVSIALPSIYFTIQKNIIHYKRLKI